FLLISFFAKAEVFSMPSLPQENREPSLFIFVSLSMPKESLKSWIQQANRVNGKLLLRGFLENSLQKTTAQTLLLLGKEGEGEILVDPESFEIFNIQVVPAVVIAFPNGCLEERC